MIVGPSLLLGSMTFTQTDDEMEVKKLMRKCLYSAYIPYTILQTIFSDK